MGKPNIIVILADDMGFSDIGCLGSEVKTPSIDSMAEKGIILSSMYNCARCCPTRSSLLTGLYPHKAGIGHMSSSLGTPAYQGYLRDEAVTVAEAVRENGYRTLMSGKWHVGGRYVPTDEDNWTPGDDTHPTPRQRGFDRFYGMVDGAGSFFFPHYLMEDDSRVNVLPDNYTSLTRSLAVAGCTQDRIDLNLQPLFVRSSDVAGCTQDRIDLNRLRHEGA